MATATMLYAGTTTGVFIASKPGTSPDWHQTRHTLAGRPVAALALGRDIPVRLLVAVPGVGLFHSLNGGREWMLTLPLDVAALLPDPADPEHIYAGLGEAADADSASPPPPGSYARLVMISHDGGLTWSSADPLPVTSTRVRSLALTNSGDPGGARTLWAGLEAGGVLRSDEQGQGWQGLLLGMLPRDPVAALSSAGREPTDLFAATDRGIYRLAPGQRSGDAPWKGSHLIWRSTAPDTPRAVRALLTLGTGPLGQEVPTLLAVDGTGGLLRSEDGGVTWTSLALRPPSEDALAGDDVLALAGHPDYRDRVYAGTRNGHIYETRNRGTAWVDTGLQLEGSVLSLAVSVIK